MQKHTLIINNQEIEVVTNNIYPKTLGYFERVTKRTIPKQPNIYRTFGMHRCEDEHYDENSIIIAYGYPNTAYAEHNNAYTASGKKLGSLADLPNLLHKRLSEFL